MKRQVGLVKLGLGDTAAAVNNLQKAVARLEPFAARKTASSRDHLNVALFRSDLADALLVSGSSEKAVDLYEGGPAVQSQLLDLCERLEYAETLRRRLAGCVLNASAVFSAREPS
ncbi:MAG: hypothetical protein P8J37_10550 [Fuerstiella sp.]|nr:hypothetical protein [Fuerstiella sp.]